MFAAAVGAPDGDMAEATPAGTSGDDGTGESSATSLSGASGRESMIAVTSTPAAEVGCRAMPVVIIGEDGDPIGRGGAQRLT